MSLKVELYFGVEELPLTKNEYHFKPVNIQTVNETEAGTRIRDIKRLGVPWMSVSMIVSDAWYQKLFDYYTSGSSITVTYYDPHTLAANTFYAYVDNLDYNLIRADSVSTDWQVSFEVVAY